jgi:hypothetical protein
VIRQAPRQEVVRQLEACGNPSILIRHAWKNYNDTGVRERDCRATVVARSGVTSQGPDKGSVDRARDDKLCTLSLSRSAFTMDLSRI